MRVSSSYRTISSEAVCVIAEMIPISLLLEEDRECYTDRHTRGVRERERADTIRKWQHQWDQATTGRWTHRLIPSLSMWIRRPYGEVNFHLTQFLSGHGCFRQYLHRFGHTSSASCPECSNTKETAEHIFFACPRFGLEREEMKAILGEDVNVDNVIQRMCNDADKWNAVNRIVTQIMSALQRKWRVEQRHEAYRSVLGFRSSERQRTGSHSPTGIVGPTSALECQPDEERRRSRRRN